MLKVIWSLARAPVFIKKLVCHPGSITYYFTKDFLSNEFKIKHSWELFICLPVYTYVHLFAEGIKGDKSKKYLSP